MSDLTPEELQGLLEWAGARLVALPTSKIRPNDIRVIWPDYSQNQFEILEFRKNAPLRASGPSKDEIPIMDEILLWPNLSTVEIRRRVLHARLLVHPIRGHNLLSWARLAKKIGSDPRTLKRAHEIGLIEVGRKIPESHVCRITAALRIGIQLHENSA